MDKQVFIFDLDGTLVDTTGIGFRKINTNLARLGYPPVSQDFLRSHWGKCAQELFKIICDEVGTNEKEYEDFCRHDKTMMDEYFLDPNLIPALIRLQDTGAILGILTSRTQESVARLATKINLELQIFEFLHTKNDHQWFKPDGRVFDPLLDWAEAEGIEPEEIVYFGDTVNYDLAATKAASTPIDFIAVVSGVNTKDEFISQGLLPCRIIDGCENLPSYLDNVISYRYRIV